MTTRTQEILNVADALSTEYSREMRIRAAIILRDRLDVQTPEGVYNALEKWAFAEARRDM